MVQLVAEALAAQVKRDAAASTRREQAEQQMTEARDHVSQLSAMARQLETLALTDPLTALPNRRGFTARWEHELAVSARENRPISLLVADIDAFKHVNDVHGHAGGDRVLQAMGQVLAAVCRSEDTAGRLGGDEFVLAVTNAAGDDAAAVGDRIRQAFAAATEALGTPCSVSIGVSGSDRTARRDLMATADQALYRSKQQGRNRVETWAPAPSGRAR
jgi:diguanylate cyclase (GGDEF)-like protein